MNSSALWAIVGIIVVAGLGFWVYSTQQVSAPAPDTTQGTPQGAVMPGDTTPGGGTNAGVGVDVGVGDASAPAAQASVVYSASGFSPATLTVAPGTRVTWTNNGGGRMWVGADEHPTHTQYDGTGRAEHCAAGYAGPAPFDQCAATDTYSFVFTKPGTFEYHNHSNAAHTGRIVVQ